MLRNVYLLLCAIISVCMVAAQEVPPTVYNSPGVASANADGSARYGAIPVSLHTGLAQIGIPLATLESNELKLSMALAYNASGNRPDMHPGWNGLGWNLAVGGVITRQTNGDFDEMHNGGPYTTTDFGLNYVDRKFLLADNSWYTSAQSRDLAPDEFRFEVNGISGVFYLDHNGDWQVRSSDNQHYVVNKEDVTLSVNYNLVNPNGTTENVLRAYTRFVLTAPDGIKYVFGGNPEAIEFSRPALLGVKLYYFVTPPPGPGTVRNYYYNTFDYYYAQRNIQSSAWYLSEIITPAGSIRFSYTNDFTFKQTVYSRLVNNGLAEGNPSALIRYDVNTCAKYLVNSCYLSSIETDQYTCLFYKSVSNELPWVYKPLTPDAFFYKALNNTAYATHTGTYYKLDSICLKNAQGNRVKKFGFEYIENSNERLKLKYVNLYALPSNVVAGKYEVKYNAKRLPVYNLGHEDHWGYYNGKNYWGSYSGVGVVDFPNVNAFKLSKEPDINLMDAEMIEQLIYPTGGYTEFVFEPHSYSSVVKRNPITLQLLGENKYAGGMRIKQIRNYDGVGSTPAVKEYFYQKDYINNGQLSSGVLSNQMEYYAEGVLAGSPDMNYKVLNSNPFNYLNISGGNHVTYTEAVERESGAGYTVNTFQNYDNGFLDKDGFAVPSGSLNVFIQNSRSFGSLALERGLLKEKLFLTEGKVPVRKEEYEYNKDPNRYSDFVRAVFWDYVEMFGQRVAFPIYMFSTAMSKKTITEYTAGGAPIVNVESYEYDPVYKYLRSVTTNASDGAFLVNTYYYPPDQAFNTNDPTGIFLKMYNKHIYSPVVETWMQKSGVDFIGKMRDNYYEPFPGMFRKIKSQVLQRDNLYKTVLDNVRYNVKGNQVNYIKGNTSYATIWGHNNSYPIARFANADVSEVFYCDFDQNGFEAGELYEDSYVAHSGKRACNIKPGFLMQRQVIPAGDYKVSYWLKGEEYIVIDGASTLSVQKTAGTNGWNFCQAKVRFATASAVLVISGNPGGAGEQIIDDFAIYPADAQMETSVYNPIVGITSTTSTNNQVTNYEYDGLNRVKLIKDGEGNILKRLCYSFADDNNACKEFIYVKIGFPNQVTSTTGTGIRATTIVKADVVLSFFTDAACTSPVAVNNLVVSLNSKTTVTPVLIGSTPTVTESTAGYTCSGNSVTVISQQQLVATNSLTGTTNTELKIIPAVNYLVAN